MIRRARRDGREARGNEEREKREDREWEKTEDREREQREDREKRETKFEAECLRDPHPLIVIEFSRSVPAM